MNSKQPNKTFHLQLVYSNDSPKDKWIIWDRNIGKKTFGGMLYFSDDRLKEELDDKPSKNNVMHFTTDSKRKYGTNENKWASNSIILPSDTFRKMTMEEYINLGYVLRHNNIIYNKKKDEFTTTI